MAQVFYAKIKHKHHYTCNCYVLLTTTHVALFACPVPYLVKIVKDVPEKVNTQQGT